MFRRNSRTAVTRPTSIRQGVRATIALAAAVPVLVSCGSSDGGARAAGSTDTITFASVPTESSTTLENSFSAVTDLIEKETGLKVEFQSASDYAAVIEGQRAGQIDIASYGPFSYVMAKDSGIDLSPVAAPTNDENTPPAYTSLAYTTSESDIESLEDLEGKRACVVDKASTSGYLIPMEGLTKADLTLGENVEEVMTGGHDASLLSLKDGDCDVAFAHDAMLKTLESSGQVEEGELTPIWESEPITEDPITLNNSTLSEEQIDAVTTALQEKANKPALVEAGICDSEDDCVLPEEIEWGYRPVDDSDFDAIREVCETTDADACHSVE